MIENLTLLEFYRRSRNGSLVDLPARSCRRCLQSAGPDHPGVTFLAFRDFSGMEHVHAYIEGREAKIEPWKPPLPPGPRFLVRGGPDS